MDIFLVNSLEQVFYVVAVIFLVIMALAFAIKGPTNRRDADLPCWEWWRADHEPDPQHNNERGHWVEW